ncbi:MAG: DUF4342 domain-containing protein [Acidobacteriota bacterium]|jgi:hypothetical protein
MGWCVPRLKERIMKGKRPRVEEFQISGDKLLAKIKELVHEGNIRRITLKNESGESLLEIPLTLGVVGTVLLPVFAAVGALAALVARLTIVVERIGEEDEEDPS